MTLQPGAESAVTVRLHVFKPEGPIRRRCGGAGDFPLGLTRHPRNKAFVRTE